MLSSETLPHSTYLHRVATGYKLAMLAILSVIVMQLPLLGVMCFCTLLIGVSLSLKQGAVMKLLRFIKTFWFIFALLMTLQVIIGEWLEGVTTILRLIALLSLAHLVTLTTSMQSMMITLMRIFAPLERFGFRSKRLSLAITLTIRFIPVLVSVWHMRCEAWRARTNKRIPLKLVALLVTDALRLADHIAEALEARGFESTQE